MFVSDSTLAVIDLETTGMSPETCRIIEVGAVKVCRRRVLETFQSLVNPGLAIPPAVTELTGITSRMVGLAPSIDGVLDRLLAFLGDSVVVGHNVAFDLAFLAAARGSPLTNSVIDTRDLAHRLVGAEVADCRLHTLARHLQVDHRPTHRALADAWATADVLDALLARAGDLPLSA
jgi:DNA polymerase-3 subunit epsilon